MLEQPEMAENHGVALVSLKLALSQETRASLAAVRVAQESAQRRARQQTMQARIWLALLVGAVALGAVTLRPRVAAWRRSRAETAKPASTPPRTPSGAPGAAAPVAMAPPAEPASAKPAAPVAREPGPSALSAAVQVAPRAKANDAGVPVEGCDTSTRSGLWRRSSAACARAFAADPKNASLALAVAQAEHAHAHLDEAAQWARRALALDPDAAEAYVIIARADAEHGRDGDARTAYQRYLEIAPRGWHKAEARTALQRASSGPR
jgi:tetratricopeptide (TPR) repeat protein